VEISSEKSVRTLLFALCEMHYSTVQGLTGLSPDVYYLPRGDHSTAVVKAHIKQQLSVLLTLVYLQD